MDQEESTQPVSTPELANSPKPKKSPLLTIIIILVILGVLAAAYFIFIAKSVGSSVLSKVVPISSSCKYNDPDLCKFINGWKEVKYFTLTSTSTFEGKEIKTIMKSVGNDKTQLVSSEGGKESMNIITIGNDTYTKDYTDGKWTKTTAQPSKDTTTIKDELNFDTKADQTEDKTTYKKIGTEACGKLTCFKYQVIDPTMSDFTEFILFDNKDYQLRRTISLGKDGNQSTSEFDYSKISIDVPSPVKETAQSQSGSVPSQEDVNKALEQINSSSSTDTTSDSSSDVQVDTSTE